MRSWPGSRSYPPLCDMGRKPPAVSASLLDASKGAHHEIHSRIIDRRRIGVRMVLYAWRGNPGLTSEKAKIRADYEVQLKAAEDRVENLNKELLQTRSDLVTAKVANTVETVYVSPRLEKPESKPVVVAAPRPVLCRPRSCNQRPKSPSRSRR